MENFDEEMLVMAPVCSEQQEQAFKEKKFRKTAATMGGIVCLLLVAASATVRDGMSSAASPLLFNRELQSKGDMFAPAPSPSGGSTGGTSSCTQTYTTSDVAAHSSPGDCWLILYDVVYDFTNYLNIHPGGSNIISNKCGTDATSSYSNIHAPSTVNSKGTSYIKGRVGTTTGQDCSGGSTGGGTAPAPAPTPSTGGGTTTGSCNVYTSSDVAKHSSSGDCWVVLMDVVYDFTNYLNRHPGGANAISSRCGTDATAAYARVHSASTVNSKGTSYIKGRLGTTSGAQSGPCTTTGGTSGGGGGGGDEDDHEEDDNDHDEDGGDDGDSDGGDEDEGDD